MGKAEDNAVQQLVDDKGLTPKNQKLADARTTALKQLLSEKGILNKDDEKRFEELAKAQLDGINRIIEKSIRSKGTFRR